MKSNCIPKLYIPCSSCRVLSNTFAIKVFRSMKMINTKWEFNGGNHSLHSMDKQTVSSIWPRLIICNKYKHSIWFLDGYHWNQNINLKWITSFPAHILWVNKFDVVLRGRMLCGWDIAVFSESFLYILMVCHWTCGFVCVFQGFKTAKRNVVGLWQVCRKGFGFKTWQQKVFY